METKGRRRLVIAVELYKLRDYCGFAPEREESGRSFLYLIFSCIFFAASRCTARSRPMAIIISGSMSSTLPMGADCLTSSLEGMK